MKKNRTPQGERVKQCRTNAGLTQEQLANRVFISKQQIWNIENGERRLTHENAVQIAKVLQVDPDYLLCESDFKDEMDYLHQAILGDDGEIKLPDRIEILLKLFKEHRSVANQEFFLDITERKKENWGWTARVDLHDGRKLLLTSEILIKLYDEIDTFMDYILFKYATNEQVLLDDSTPPISAWTGFNEKLAGAKTEQFKQKKNKKE